MNIDRYAAGMTALRRLGGPDVAEPVLAAADIAPDLVRFAIEFAFGDVLSRPGLELPVKELCTVAALAALHHPASQLAWHQQAAQHVGATPDQIEEATRIARACTGRVADEPRGGSRVLDEATRALVTVAALTASGHDRRALAEQMNAALSAGVSREQVVQVLEQMAVYAGFPAALNGIAVARDVFRAAAPDAVR
jgi:4-carboxymuconolactone decarboxylase